MKRTLVVSWCGWLALVGALSGAENRTVPVTVSPGSGTGVVEVAAPCPTFSWGEVETGELSELIVYRVGSDGGEARPVLRHVLPGSVGSWTPGLHRCLERGERYAWTVRSVGSEAASDWSDPRFFRVAAGPSEEEFERAVAVVRQYLENRDKAPAARPVAQVGATSSGSEAERAVDQLEARGTNGSLETALAPESPAAPTTVSLVTDGAVAVGRSTPLADLHVVGEGSPGTMWLAPSSAINGTSELLLAEDEDGTFGVKLKYDGDENLFQILGYASGDTIPWLTIERDSGATMIRQPDPPCVDYVQRFADCGNGTVTDSVTRLVYLKNANCFGFAEWVPAVQAVDSLAHGQCGLSDGSRAGDWRLPAKDEWEDLIRPICGANPKIVGNGNTGGTPDCYSNRPWAMNLVSDSYWTSTTKEDDTDNAWRARLVDADVQARFKGQNNYIWAVRDRR